VARGAAASSWARCGDTRTSSRPSSASRGTPNEWNVAESARQLDLARSHVYNLINALGLARKD